jgi:hypothetical protein
MSARRLALAGLVSLCVSCGVVVLAGASAQAAVIHKFLSQESSVGFKPFGEAGPVAVDESTSLTDWAKGDVYEVVGGGKPSGDVVDVFEPEAGGKRKLVAQLTGTSPSKPFEYLGVVAVNNLNGDLIVNNYQGRSVLSVFEPTVFGEYALVATIHNPQSEGGIERFAVDQTSHEIYATSNHGPSGFEATLDEFNSAGEFLDQITGTPAGKFPGYNTSVSVEPISRDVYVLDAEYSLVYIFGPDITVPDVTTGPVARLTGKSATLMGTVNPDKAGAATCQFEWGATTAFGHVAPCSAPVAEGGSPVPVEAQIEGLEPHTNYCYRLQATDANGTNPGDPAQDRCFTTPGLESHPEAVSAVTAESVTFNATINPRGVPTTYYFQYGTTSGYGTDVPSASGTAVGSGEGDVEVSQHAQGLRADTVYHYRVVALIGPEGKLEEFDGPDQTFTTQRAGSALGLPDGREWELVTPPDKHGALFFGLNYGNVSEGTFVAEASVDGGAVVDLASQPTEDGPLGNTSAASVFSARGAAGWSSQVIASPHAVSTGPSIGEGEEYRLFSEDLSRAVVQPFGNFDPLLSAEASESTPYLRAVYSNGNVQERCKSSCYEPLVMQANTREGTVFGEKINGVCINIICGPQFMDATPDLSHVVLRSSVQLTSTPNQSVGVTGKYYYEWSGGQLQPLYLLPKGEGGVGVYLGELERGAPIDHQLSDDGSLFFAYGGHLYMHSKNISESVRLDVAQGVAEPSKGGASFLYASRDGSRVFFTDSQQLTKANGGGIYECRIVEAAGSTTCELELTGLSGGSLVGGSDDASYLYFMGAGEKLIVDRYSGREWTTTEGPVIPQTGASGFLHYETRGGLPPYRVSPNGRFIAFMSDHNLTGYDNRDAVSGQPDGEVYLYDASSNKLVCASCNPTGARPVGVEYQQTQLVAGFGVPPLWTASNVPPWTRSTGNPSSTLYQPRYLSDSGRLFFDSNDALVPQDVNGTQDVYEYEPVGVGSCGASSVTFGERSDGCVSLVSSGTSPVESAFMDASVTGGDVFFITHARLVSQDYDNALDVYDAHECSAAVPCYPAAPVSPPVCSTGDACKASPTPQPSIFGPSPSATFSGAGNVVPSTAVAPGVGGKSLSGAQKLARALRACRKKGHRRRGVCERDARKRYGMTGKSRKANAMRKGRG